MQLDGYFSFCLIEDISPKTFLAKITISLIPKIQPWTQIAPSHYRDVRRCLFLIKNKDIFFYKTKKCSKIYGPFFQATSSNIRLYKIQYNIVVHFTPFREMSYPVKYRNHHWYISRYKSVYSLHFHEIFEVGKTCISMSKKQNSIFKAAKEP